MLALVLSGGGARGAYEAGVLRYVFDTLPRELGREVSAQIVCGTSIGALTGAWIAAMGQAGAVLLARAWQTMETDDVYKLNLADVLTWPPLYRRAGMGAAALEGQALFDPTPLYDSVSRTLPWEELRRRLDTGALRALVVSTTEVMSGRCVLFTDGNNVTPRETATTRIVPTRIGPEHCLASAAIPLVFPSVRIGDRFYVDGSLRQNTPVLPAITLGADRVLVVGVKRSVNPEEQKAPNAPPPAMFLAGKAFDALLLDDIEEDLRRVESVNALLRWGESAYGGFAARLAREHRPFRVIETRYVRPTRDLGQIAAGCFEEHRRSLPTATRWFLDRLHDQQADDNSDLLSYLYFHKSFTGELEKLGYDDAAAMAEDLAALV